MIYALTLVLCFFIAVPAVAQTRISLILDAELENWLQELAQPLINQTNLTINDIRINIVRGSDVNAFVTEGRQLYIFSGLLLKAENHEEIQGVIAHEIGHIQAHHILNTQEKADTLQAGSIASALLGIGAAIAGGGQAATAVMATSQAALMSNFLQHSRTQEREADQIATDLLQKSGLSAKGMVSFFEKLRGQQLLYSQTPPAHLLTHPLPQERLNNLQNFARTEKTSQKAAPQLNFARLQAKLYAYTHQPMQTLRKYNGSSEADRYAQTIAYAFKGDIQKSTDILSALLNHRPKDPFYHELLAEIFVDHGKINESIPHYEIALKHNPNLNLTRFQYGNALRAIGRSKEAIPQLQQVKEQKPYWSMVYHALGLAYGETKQLAKSHLSLVEEAVLKRNFTDAKLHLKLAEPYMKNTDSSTKERFTFLTNHIVELEKE